LHYFSIFTEYRIESRMSFRLVPNSITLKTETSNLSYSNFKEGNILLKERTQTINNEI